jgi:hypothetical protein
MPVKVGRRFGGRGLAAEEVPAALRSSGGEQVGNPELGMGVNPYIMTPTNAISGKVCTDKVQVLSFGIDTIYLNFHGDLSPELLLLLPWAKEDAQNSPIREDLSPLPPFLGTNLLMQPKGAQHYDYLVRSDDLTIKLKEPTKGLPLPPMVVRISSECLWRLGGGGWPAIDAVLAWAHELFPNGYDARVSSFHQCGDVQGWLPVVADLGGIVKRADTIEIYDADGEKVDNDGLSYTLAKGDAIQGVSAGRSNRLRASVYDKTKELKKSGKDWFRDVWAQVEGYRADLPVWRIEYQYGREFLHKYRIETVEDLRAQQDALFRYGLAWFAWRVRQDTDLAHPQRWPMIAAWVALGASRPVSAPLPAARMVRPKLLRLSQGAYGYLSTIMAITGETDEEVALARLLADVRRQKGIEGMRDVLRKKQQRYKEVGGRVPWAGRASLAEVADDRRVRGDGLVPVHKRLHQWGDGLVWPD